MAKLSVIVPVYRAEDCLRRCTQSILGQDFTDFELLLVDDGSPDNSGQLCDEIGQEDDRVRVIHKKNGGVSSARNMGMAQARGEYIAFADADDWWEPGAFTLMMDALLESGGDSVACGHKSVYPDGTGWTESAAMAPGVHGARAIRTGIVNRLLGERLGQEGEVLNGFVWRFFFARQIIMDKNIVFVGAYLEDELFLLEYFCHSEKLAVVDLPLYNYLQNPASVTRNYLPDYMDTFEKFMAKKRELATRFGLELPLWQENSNWAGLLIAIGNEYARGNTATMADKQRAVKRYTQRPDMVVAIRTVRPMGIWRNKQIVANLVRWRQFGLLTLLYRVKNRKS